VDAIDVCPLALALDTTRCPATSAAAIARLPATCFAPYAARPESAASTYFTPDVLWLRFPVPAAVLDGRDWDLHLSFMVHHGTLDDVSPAGIVRAHEDVGMDVPVAVRRVHVYDDRVPLPAHLAAGDTLVLEVRSPNAFASPNGKRRGSRTTRIAINSPAFPTVAHSTKRSTTNGGADCAPHVRSRSSCSTSTISKRTTIASGISKAISRCER
jgi:hypothetical protein